MMNANNFLKYCFGIALVAGTLLFGSAALIYSTTPATAAHPNTTYGTGKYMMQMNTINSNDDVTYWYILVWDTETGTSKMYQTNGKSSSGFTCPGSKYAPPSSPL